VNENQSESSEQEVDYEKYAIERKKSEVYRNTILKKTKKIQAFDFFLPEAGAVYGIMDENTVVLQFPAALKDTWSNSETQIQFLMKTQKKGTESD